MTWLNSQPPDWLSTATTTSHRPVRTAATIAPIWESGLRGGTGGVILARYRGQVRDRSESRYAAGALSPQRRLADLQRLRDETFDVLIVGGGVTGAGAALDAASRGLKVALIEGADLASGTSSRSSKLIHGGLRYLEQLEFPLVHEALARARPAGDTACAAPGAAGAVPGAAAAGRLVRQGLAPCLLRRRAGALRRFRRPGRARPRHAAAPAPDRGGARGGCSRRCARPPWPAPSATTTGRSTTPDSW